MWSCTEGAPHVDRRALLGRVSPALLSALFFVMTGGSGSFVPFLGLYLERSGASGPELAFYLATMPFARIVAGPLWAMFADRFRRGDRILVWTTAASAGLAAVVLLPVPPVVLGLALVLFAIARAPIGPLLDTMAVRALHDAGRDVRDYGRIRLWGSLGYLLVGGAASLIASAHPAGALWLAVGAWVSAAVFALRLPRTPAAPPTTIGPALRALSARRFAVPYGLGLVFAGAGLNVYDALYAVHLASRGLPSAWLGLALAAGIATEMSLMAWGGPILRRVDPFALAALAMLAGVVRWGLTAWLHDPWLLTAVQASHGLVFGAFWLASVEIFRARAPAVVQNSAQSALTTISYGVGPLLTSAATWACLDRFGTDGLFALAAGSTAIAGALFVIAGVADAREVDADHSAIRPRK